MPDSTPSSSAPTEMMPGQDKAALDTFGLKPLGWVLLDKNGDIVSWKPEVHDIRINPADSGLGSLAALSDELNPELAPHSWTLVAAMPKERS